MGVGGRQKGCVGVEGHQECCVGVGGRHWGCVGVEWHQEGISGHRGHVEASEDVGGRCVGSGRCWKASVVTVGGHKTSASVGVFLANGSNYDDCICLVSH